MMAGYRQAHPKNAIRDILGLPKRSQQDDFIGAWLVEVVLSD
jgi:hypothetical protein